MACYFRHVLLVSVLVTFGEMRDPHHSKSWFHRSPIIRMTNGTTVGQVRRHAVQELPANMRRMQAACAFFHGNDVVIFRHKFQCVCHNGYVRKQNPERCVKRKKQSGNKPSRKRKSKGGAAKKKPKGGALTTKNKPKEIFDNAPNGAVLDKDKEIANLRKQLKEMKRQDFIKKSRIRVLQAIMNVRAKELQRLKERTSWINDNGDKTKAIPKQKKKLDKMAASIMPNIQPRNLNSIDPTQQGVHNAIPDKVKSVLTGIKINEKLKQDGKGKVSEQRQLDIKEDKIRDKILNQKMGDAFGQKKSSLDKKIIVGQNSQKTTDAVANKEIKVKAKKKMLQEVKELREGKKINAA